MEPSVISVPAKSKISVEEIQENLQVQLSELESLQSMFYNPGELIIEDIGVLSEIKSFVKNPVQYLPLFLDLTIRLLIENLKFEMCVTLPHKYPHVEPEIFVRHHKLGRSQHINLNKDLYNYVCSLEKGEPSIFLAISWLQDHAHKYIDNEEVTQPCSIDKEEKYVRYWIYSHHIYSKTKRKEIVDLAKELEITGFSMPGKPGIICVEGTKSECNEWWQAIKSLSWKKIFIKIVEEDKEDQGKSFLKFSTFEEVVFQNNGIKYNHMNMSELHHYLTQHQVGYIFKDIFGVEVKPSA